MNGEPVDLHMKLGDNGEAFFVQEAEQYNVRAFNRYSPSSFHLVIITYCMSTVQVTYHTFKNDEINVDCLKSFYFTL